MGESFRSSNEHNELNAVLSGPLSSRLCPQDLLLGLPFRTHLEEVIPCLRLVPAPPATTPSGFWLFGILYFFLEVRNRKKCALGGHTHKEKEETNFRPTFPHHPRSQQSSTFRSNEKLYDIGHRLALKG